MRRSRYVLLFLAVIVLATGAPASACSCVISDNRDRLARADAAIIGTALSVTPTEDEGTVTYTFSVDEEVKGDFDDTVQISTASNGAACGLEVGIGDQTGLFLSGSQTEGWSSSLCQQISPRELREAARPLPEPDGEGPIRLIAGGSWGEMGLLALDSEGRTLMYGKRDSGSSVVDVCPGSSRFIEVPWGGRRRWVIRETSTLDVVDVVTLPRAAYPPRDSYPQECLAEDASEVLVRAIRYGEPRSKSSLYRYSDGNFKILYEGSSTGFTLVGDRVYLTEGDYGRNVRVLDLDTGKKTFIARVPRYAHGVAVSPNERYIATSTGAEREKLVVIDTKPSPADVITRDHGTGMAGELYWVDNDTLVYLPGGYDNNKAKIFNARLLGQRVLDGFWYTLTEGLFGDVAYGVGWGGLYRARLPEGPAELLREFPSPEIHTVSVVPDEVHPTPSP